MKISSVKHNKFFNMKKKGTPAKGKLKKKGGKPVKKRSFLFWILKGMKWIALVVIGSALLFVLLYKFVNPPVTPLMLIRAGTQLSSEGTMSLKKDWVPLKSVSPSMVRAVIASEDNLFIHHHGFDTKAIEKAIENNKKGRKLKGGSTISQQTAKNVFLWPQRSWLRKGLEVGFTFLIETVWGKKRIMEVYLNVIETGPGIYGVEKAAQIYFHKSSSSLTAAQAALIAASLPSPLKYSVSQPGPYMISRQASILDLMDKIETLPEK